MTDLVTRGLSTSLSACVVGADFSERIQTKRDGCDIECEEQGCMSKNTIVIFIIIFILVLLLLDYVLYSFLSLSCRMVVVMVTCFVKPSKHTTCCALASIG